MKRSSWLKNLSLLSVLLVLLLAGFMSNSEFEKQVFPLPKTLQKKISEKKKINETRERVVVVKIIRIPPQKEEAKKVEKVKKTEKKEQAKPPVINKPKISTPVTKKSVSHATSESNGKVVTDIHKDGGPALVARYELSVSRYLAWARTRGCMPVLYDVRAGKIACRIESDGGFTTNFQDNGFSPRARRLTVDHPRNTAVLHKAAKRFGRSIYEILLLLPVALDNDFNQRLRHIVETTGQLYSEVVTVRLSYLDFHPSGRLQVRVDKIETGSSGVTINRRFIL